MSDAIEEVIRCKRLEVLDDDGTVRAVIGLDRQPDGKDWDSVSLGLRTPEGKELVALYCESQVSGLEFWEQGNNVASIHTNRDGLASIDVADERTGERVFAMVNDPVMPVRLTNPVEVSFGLPTLKFLRMKGRFSITER